MPSSLSFLIVFSDLTPITRLLKLVRLFQSYPQTDPELNFAHSLRGKVHPHESQFLFLTERQRIKAITLSAFLYVFSDFE